MTKTLTEQWREGKLPIGKYYIKTKWWGCDDKWHYEKEEDIDYLDGDWRFYQDDAVAEVLAPVPAFDVWKNIHEQWKVAIPQIERLQEQLKEANEVIKGYSKLESLMNVAFGKREKGTAQKYVEKWCVK